MPFKKDLEMEKPTKKTVVIQGVQFEIIQPFEEGHVCTLAEAKALNQTRSENIRNNSAKSVKEALAAENMDEALKEVAKKIAAYDKEYQFTIGGTGAAKLDPIEREARKIVRAAITAQLREAGRKISEVDKTKLADIIAEQAEKPEVIKAAKKALADKAKLADSILDGVTID